MTVEANRRARVALAAAVVVSLAALAVVAAGLTADSGHAAAGAPVGTTTTAPSGGSGTTVYGGPIEPGPGGEAAAPVPGPADDATRSAGPPAEAEDGASGGPAGPAPSGDQRTALRFIYFVEADQVYDPEAPALIEQQALALQQFWFDQFGGTFRLADPAVEVVFGEHEAAWYDETPAGDDSRWFRLTNIRAEVRFQLAIDPDSGVDSRLITYPAARIDGRVGANRYDGAWMDGDDLTCIGGLIDTTPYSSDYPANCLTTVAHELGHVYGLGHEGEDTDCMQFGFYRYMLGTGLCDFSAEHRATVTADPRNAAWLDAAPGDRLG